MLALSPLLALTFFCQVRARVGSARADMNVFTELHVGLPVLLKHEFMLDFFVVCH